MKSPWKHLKWIFWLVQCTVLVKRMIIKWHFGRPCLTQKDDHLMWKPLPQCYGLILTGAILNDFLQKRIQGWGEHSQEESQTLNNGQIGGKLSQLALFWRINTEGRRQTESKRERQKVDQRGSHLKRRAPKRQVDIRRGVDFALHQNQLCVKSILNCERCSYNTRTQLQQQVRSQGACSAVQ